MLETKNDSADRRARVARALAKDGFEDVYILSRETAREVLTEKRLELLRALRQKDVESIRELADLLERDQGDVSRDVNLLAHHDLITFEEDGRRKIPRVKHQTVIVEPLL